MSQENNFGKNIKKLRTDKNMSQTELANVINISPQAISKWENNKSVPDILTIKELADFFEVPLESILSDKVLSNENDSKNDEDLVIKQNNYPFFSKRSLLMALFITVNFMLTLLLMEFFLYEHPLIQYVILFICYIGLISFFFLIDTNKEKIYFINTHKFFLVINTLYIISIIILYIIQLNL